MCCWMNRCHDAVRKWLPNPRAPRDYGSLQLASLPMARHGEHGAWPCPRREPQRQRPDHSRQTQLELTGVALRVRAQVWQTTQGIAIDHPDTVSAKKKFEYWPQQLPTSREQQAEDKNNSNAATPASTMAAIMAIWRQQQQSQKLNIGDVDSNGKDCGGYNSNAGGNHAGNNYGKSGGNNNNVRP